MEDPRWMALDDLEALAEKAAGASLAALGLPQEGFQIALLAASDARIAALNADFRGKPKPTNVLSWPSEERAPGKPGARPAPPKPGLADNPESLGDIALAFETCAAEAAAQGKALADHVTHLFIHGLLHLLGYDHESEADAALMEGEEVRILAKLGLANPY